jgi:hypothetical protein
MLAAATVIKILYGKQSLEAVPILRKGHFFLYSNASALPFLLVGIIFYIDLL